MERHTRQRAAIREASVAAARPLLPQEVLQAAQQQVPGLGIATVYRNLKGLVEEGELRAVHLPGENPRFEATGHAHHHHFQCRQCQRVFDVHACPGDLSRLAPQGFTVEDHDLTLYGRCQECSTARPARRLRASPSPPPAAATS
jgi:Fur family ferric uptake transcriptional regulator